MPWCRMYKCPKCQKFLVRAMFGNGQRKNPYCTPCLYEYRRRQRILNLDEARTKDRLRWLKPERKEWMKLRRQKEENKLVAAQRSKKWREANPDWYKELLLQWRNTNREKVSQYTREKLHALKQRTPAWLTTEDKSLMSVLYGCAEQLTAETGERWCVDHVLPLRGKLVSGLHVPLNLHICTLDHNRRKSNIYVVD